MLLDGTFKSWHGLRFFRQLNLKSNPLEVIENDAFDKLPSMQYLDLRGTKLTVQMMYPAFMAVPNIVQLDVPDAVRCCLCYVARTVEILFNTVKIQCSDPCANDTSCDFKMAHFLAIPLVFIILEEEEKKKKEEERELQRLEAGPLELQRNIGGAGRAPSMLHQGGSRPALRFTEGGPEASIVNQQGDHC
ncbi:leucine-rich repeat-containing protein 37B-like [Heptranchias perlo]|uniref:leucine-rich repeat-containing protein 37B-like n=1 Tax=Heptranchias perlo TaxID=212740 RepID=UPI00355952F4